MSRIAVILGGVVLLLGSGCSKTDNFRLINKPDYFFRSAEHHDFKAVETYAWRNCGESAVVDLEAKPSCSNDVSVNVYDAEGTLVFGKTFHAPHCFHGKKDWAPLSTSKGVPGVWTIVLSFDVEGLDELEILITREGPCVHDVIAYQGNNGVGNGPDPQPPGQPPVNDGVGTSPGSPGSQGGPFLRWTSTHTADRDVKETYLLRMSGDVAGVQASWDTFTEGSLAVTIADGEGNVVYSHLFAPGHTQPFSDVTSPGAPGVWKVTLEASDLISTQLALVVYAP